MESYLTAEISASAVAANLALLRQQIKPPTRLCAVVKADCYGHGIHLLWKTIAEFADCMAVATPTEAIWLRGIGYNGPLLMFFSACAYNDGGQLREALEELVAQHVTLTVISAAEAFAVSEASRKVRTPASVHVKVDTGMGRSGILWEDAPALVAEIARYGGVKVTGLYTHLATADSADKSYAASQLANFQAAARRCPNPSSLLLHAANSAGTIDMSEAHMSMVRPGIAIYGYQPSDDMQTRLPLRPALRLWGRLMQIKELPAGSKLSYGLTHTLARDSRLGLAPVGYGDGYLRCLSNKATMRVRGKDVPILGRVCMDQVIIDLTDAPAARVGDMVEIISSDPAAPHSVENLARLADTIPYEVTCRLGRRVQRVLVDTDLGQYTAQAQSSSIPQSR